jgi:hypothetical protein
VVSLQQLNNKKCSFDRQDLLNDLSSDTDEKQVISCMAMAGHTLLYLGTSCGSVLAVTRIEDGAWDHCKVIFKSTNGAITALEAARCNGSTLVAFADTVGDTQVPHITSISFILPLISKKEFTVPFLLIKSVLLKVTYSPLDFLTA